MIRLGLCAIPPVSALIVAACGGAGPERVGAEGQRISPSTDVELASNGATAFGTNILEPERWFGVGDLGTTPVLSLQSGSSLPIEAAFRSPLAQVYTAGSQAEPLYFVFPAELALFTRSPEEHRQMLWDEPLSAWRQLLTTPRLNPPEEQEWYTSEFGLPAAVVIPYTGPQPTWTTLTPVQPGAFWATDIFPTMPSSWTAPGTNPTGYGSIKSALATSFGPCNASVDIENDILLRIKSSLELRLVSQTGKPIVFLGTSFGNVTNVHILGLGLSSYLAPSRDLWAGLPGGSAPLGGVLMKGDVQIDVHAAQADLHCEVNFRVDYRFGLNDGYLAMTPVLHEVTSEGPDSLCSTVRPSIEDAILQELPNTVHDIALDQQRYDFHDVVEPDATFGCDDLTDPAAPQTPIYSCENAAENLKAFARAGAARFLGTSVAQLPFSWRTTIEQTIDFGAQTPDGTRNWTCAARYKNNQELACRPQGLRCLFNLRASNVRSTPDQANLEWFRSFDPTSYVDNHDRAALAFFFAAIELNKTSVLCNRSTPMVRSENDPDGHWFNRYFATAFQRDLSSSHSSAAVPDQCCENASDPVCLFQSEQCDDKTHRCTRHACLFDEICHPDETCVGASGLSSGVCQRFAQPTTPCDPRYPFKDDRCPAGTMCYPDAVCRR
ncbi:hypothetical protein BH09MYX1_BH09MYX1_11280 [soil metagenome]